MLNENVPQKAFIGGTKSIQVHRANSSIVAAMDRGKVSEVQLQIIGNSLETLSGQRGPKSGHETWYKASLPVEPPYWIHNATLFV